MREGFCMSNKKKRPDPPEKTAGDATHSLIKGAISSLPVLGPITAEIFGHVFTPPLERRRVEWMNDVANRLEQLQKKGYIKYKDLQKNDAFITTVSHAYYAAIRNHQNEKREALKNVVLNSAMPDAPDESRQQFFLNFVDTCTEWHLRIMTLLDKPKQCVEGKIPKGEENSIHRQMLSTLLDYMCPGFGDETEYIKVLWQDLLSKGFVRTGDNMLVIYENLLKDEELTILGKKFLEFITEPILKK